jgi:peptidoglycan/LPS O-acetylase OafA/YrhL
MGPFAVGLFFVISGYLMPLAIVRYSSAGRFLLNRLLRIYPLYWLSLVLAILYLQLHDLPAPSLTQNFTLLGLNQEWLWGGYERLNNPAWTLDVELQYYLLVPLLVSAWRRSRGITLAMMLAAAAVSTYLLLVPTGVISVDRSLLAWSALFVGGFLAYQCGVLMPRSGPFDGFLGDLSYPVYILHYFLIGLVHSRVDAAFTVMLAANIAFCLIVCAAVVCCFERPLERIRAMFRS